MFWLRVLTPSSTKADCPCSAFARRSHAGRWIREKTALQSEPFSPPLIFPSVTVRFLAKVFAQRERR
jgi:hypothetical protein